MKLVGHITGNIFRYVNNRHCATRNLATISTVLECFDAVGWAAGRASGL